MKPFAIQLPIEIRVEFRREIGTRTVKLQGKSPEWFEWAIAKGLRNAITESIAGKAGTDEGLKAVQDKFDRVVVRGEVPGVGISGPRLDATQRGWIAYFAAINHKEADKPVSSRTLARAKETYCRQVILASCEAGPEKESAMRDMREYLEEYSQQIIKDAEKDITPGSPGAFIALENSKDLLCKSATCGIKRIKLNRVK